VTDRLWEISDLVEMLESFEEKDKRDSRPIFEVIQWAVGGGFYVRATLPNQQPVQIDGFATKAEAVRWVRNDSQLWLQESRQKVSRHNSN